MALGRFGQDLGAVLDSLEADSQGLTLRIQAASFDEVVTYDALVRDTPVDDDRTRVRDFFASTADPRRLRTAQQLTAQASSDFSAPVTPERTCSR